MGRQVDEPVFFESGNEKEYFVTKIRTEDAGNGNVRVYAYRVNHGNEWHLLYTAVVPALELTEMGRQCVAAGSEAEEAPHRVGKFTN